MPAVGAEMRGERPGRVDPVEVDREQRRELVEAGQGRRVGAGGEAEEARAAGEAAHQLVPSKATFCTERAPSFAQRDGG